MDAMAPLPPKREQKPRTAASSKSVYLGEDEERYWTRLQEIARIEGYKSRNELLAGLIRQFVDDYDKPK